MVDDAGVLEDLDEGQVRVDLLGAASSRGAAAHPRNCDPAVLHPGDEDTAGVSRVAPPGQGTLHQGLQCWQV